MRIEPLPPELRGPAVYLATEYAAPRVRGVLVGLGYSPRRLDTAALLRLLGLVQRLGADDDRDDIAALEVALELMVLDAGARLELSARSLSWSRLRRAESLGPAWSRCQQAGLDPFDALGLDRVEARC